ncbi:ketoisovalerate oxidoreductase subunit VorA [Candidatus Methanoplasma termitum]|uniref:VorA protein n=1 Tax=Candidatus Methanoplasma termitum TaxID=1577791 RepID=A0A0A7LBJ6_9ARCH|nr:2-oxoacid:acceptor oxidoreductase family protein [Candidatus Methanoplasma termitum]AIZ56444.1 ketoisovalerate oxidoreductase subunit VorA [Candidatus Methanoplasma termitum]
MIKRATGMYEHFSRNGREAGDDRATHYCAGCGHGIILKLIGEAMADLGIQNDSVFVGPVGCATFCYYYIDCGHISAPHGRASAVATGLSRVLPDKPVIAYQGDGDLGAIGFNNAFQAANRGENFALFFVNNALFAMTGGQMAPTTLEGQVTTTTPYGRDVVAAGYPLRVCEVFETLEAPVFIERVSVADTKRIMQAKKAIRKALEIQKEKKGFAFVEILSPCPNNMREDPVKAAESFTQIMEKTYPLGNFKDRSEKAAPVPKNVPHKTVKELMAGGKETVPMKYNPSFRERRFKFSGFGGQGILSLGLVVAEAAASEGKFVSWMPSYGPEQRGGSASCAVRVWAKEIGSPTVDDPDVLIAMNQPSLERFAPTVAKGGTLLFEASIKADIKSPPGVRVIPFPASAVANESGVPKASNTAFLGAMTGLGLLPFSEKNIKDALAESFSAKPALVEPNMRVFEAAKKWISDNIN